MKSARIHAPVPTGDACVGGAVSMGVNTTFVVGFLVQTDPVITGTGVSGIATRALETTLRFASVSWTFRRFWPGTGYARMVPVSFTRNRISCDAGYDR